MASRFILPVLLAAVVFPDLSALAGQQECEPQPVRVAIQVAPSSSLDGRFVRSVNEDVWGRAGITFDWVISRDFRLNDLDVLALIDEPRLRHAPPGALGAVEFADGRPSKIVRVSSGAVTRWYHDQFVRSRGLPAFVPWNFSRDVSRAMAERALGFAVAHEIGHIVLASSHHSREGLMRPEYVDINALEAGATLLSLDATARERLTEVRGRAPLCGQRSTVNGR